MSVPKDNKDGICYEYLVYHKEILKTLKNSNFVKDPKVFYYENKR